MKLLLVHGCKYELVKTYLAVTIWIRLQKQILSLLNCEWLSKKLVRDWEKFLLAQHAITIWVNCLENFSVSLSFLLWNLLRKHERVHNLLHFRKLVEFNNILKHSRCLTLNISSLCFLCLKSLRNPNIIDSFLGCGTFMGLHSEQSLNELAPDKGNVLPDFVTEIVFTFTDFFFKCLFVVWFKEG